MSNCKTGLADFGNIERDPVFLSQKAKPGGVATLDANGKVPLSQIDIKALFTERDPVYLADRGVPFGVPTLDGSVLVVRSFLGTGPANSTTVLFGDGVWRPGGGGGNTGWQLIGTVISEVTLTNKVVVGSATPLGKFSVVGDTPADVTTVVQGAPGQTADILRVLDSTGSQLFAIGASVFIDMANGSSAPVSPSNHGRQRYNNTVGNKGFEVSVDGGPWERVIADEREVERIASMLDL
jgi:hypothetical protein